MTKNPRPVFIPILLVAPWLVWGASAVNSAEARPPEPLPNVLIIGDSISIGYMPHVAEMLRGEATVRHNEGNAEHTGTGLRSVDQWLGATKWDVIHFNWGLWDLCYRNPASRAPGNRDKLNGTVTTSLAQYERNLEQLVARLEKTGATLIWAETTVVPPGEVGRIVGDDAKYNEVAAAVMKRHGVVIDDLHSLTKRFPQGLFEGPGDVHYRDEGYRKIAARVAESIRSALKGRREAVARAAGPAAGRSAGNSHGPAAGGALKSDPFSKSTSWIGTAVVNETPVPAIITVIERGDRAAKLLIEYGNGAVWAFDCAVNGGEMTIEGAERRKLADVAVGKPNSVSAAEARGTGSVNQGKLTLNYKVPDPTGRVVIDVRLKAEARRQTR
jgi:hypothetical protein